MSETPLLQQLPEELQLRLKDGPKIVYEKILAHESQLAAQIRRYTELRRDDLVEFATSELQRAEEDSSRKAVTKEAPEQVPNSAEPKLKSSVKQPSALSREKRVSFSESPPQVETFCEEDYTDLSDTDLGESPGDAPDYELTVDNAAHTIPSSYNKLVHTANPEFTGTDPSDIDIGEYEDIKPGTASNDSLVTIDHLADSESPPPSGTTVPDPEHFAEGLLSARTAAPKYNLAASITQDVTTEERHRRKEEEHDDPLFSFEDVIEHQHFDPYDPHGDEEPETLSGKVEEAEDIEQLSDNSTLSKLPNVSQHKAKEDDDGLHTPASYRDEEFFVGSAPIDIRHPFRGFDSDGGPAPKSRLEHEDDLDTYPTSPSDTNLDDTIDPAAISFSQRMMWEQQRKR